MNAESLVVEWAKGAFVELDAGAIAVSADIDELLGEVPPLAGSVSLAMFRATVEVLDEAKIEANALLTLPLPDTRRLLTEAPSIEGLIQSRWHWRQPPEIAILRPWARRYDIEEYRRAVEFDVQAARPVHTFYRVSRLLEAREHGWEYTRAFDLWADWVPPNQAE